MTARRRALLFPSLAVLLCLAGSPRAGFVNGGFESGDFSGWTRQYNSVDQCSLGSWTSTLPPGHPAPAIVTASTGLLPNQALDVDPYSGSRMARINNTFGQCHVTRLSQTGPLEAGDLAAGGYLSLDWGAILQDPGHNLSCQPYFSVDILVNGTPAASFAATATVAGQNNSGWISAGSGNTAPYWYRSGSFCLDLNGVALGTPITVEATVADCGKCGHGALAYLDSVAYGPECCVQPPDDMIGWWPLDRPTATLVSPGVPVTPLPFTPVAFLPIWTTDLASGHDGLYKGPLLVAGGPLDPGFIDGSKLFGNGNWVEVPHPTDGSLDRGPATAGGPPHNGDFSVDAWVRLADAAGTHPIVSKYGSICGYNGPAPPSPAAPLEPLFCPSAGYGFYVQDARLGLALKDRLDFMPSHYLSNVIPTLDDDEWHLVAVTVDRDSPTGIRFFFDDQVVSTATPDPAAESESLGNAGSFLIGRDVSFFPQTESFVGRLDEVEFFHRALDNTEIEQLFLAGAVGKCKAETASLPPKGYFCGNYPWKTVRLAIHNGTNQSQTYRVTAYPMPAGPVDTVNGPLVDIDEDVHTVPAFERGYVDLRVARPTEFDTSGQEASYKVRVENLATGYTFGDVGTVGFLTWPCWNVGVISASGSVGHVALSHPGGGDTAGGDDEGMRFVVSRVERHDRHRQGKDLSVFLEDAPLDSPILLELRLRGPGARDVEPLRFRPVVADATGHVALPREVLDALDLAPEVELTAHALLPGGEAVTAELTLVDESFVEDQR